MLFVISLAVELGALLMTIGLGLYLVTRSMHRPEAWLAALTSWSMGGLFLNMLFSLMPPPVPDWLGAVLIFWPKGILEQDPTAWLRGWTSTLAPAFWFHATMLMRSDPMKTRQRITVIVIYTLSLIGIAIQALLPTQYNIISGDPLYLNSLQGGPVYGLFLGSLVLVSSLSIRNLALAAQAEPRHLPRRQLIMLSAATILAGLTGPVGLVAAFLKIPVPMFLVALLIGAGILVTGFGVARYSALMESRVFERDFFYSVFTNSAAVAFYLGITWVLNRLYHLPPYVYVLVGILAVISHMLIDIARQNVDFLFFQHEKRLLRERLRSLAGQTEADLHRDLSRLLESICEPIQASYAILLVRQDELYEQAAAYHWRQAEFNLPAALLAADDLKPLQPGELPEPIAEALLLIPIYLGDQQVGALLLGAAEHGLAYSPVEIDGLQEFGDYLGAWLGQLKLQRDEQAEQLKQEFPPEPELFSSSPAKISTHTVELGLRSLHDYAKLAELPLVDTNLVRQRSGNSPSHIETGKAVQSLLCEAVEKLRPPGAEEEKHINRVPRRDWYPYIILRDAYVDCLPNREVMDRLFISEGTFNRTRRSAIRSLTRLLIEMES